MLLGLAVTSRTESRAKATMMLWASLTCVIYAARETGDSATRSRDRIVSRTISKFLPGYHSHGVNLPPRPGTKLSCSSKQVLAALLGCNAGDEKMCAAWSILTS